MEKQRLRKRRVVVIGCGLGAITFCQKFKSKFAEITLITSETAFAPDPVLNGIAAGKLEAERFTRLISVLFSKRKDFTLINDTVESIHLEERRLRLSNSDDIEYDFLLVGKEVTDKQSDRHSIASYSESVRLNKKLKATENKFLGFIGNGTRGIEAAINFTTLTDKTTLVNPDEESFYEAENNQLTRLNYAFRQMGLHMFQEAYVDNWDGEQITVGEQTIPCNILIDSHASTIPACIQKLEFETEQNRLLKTRPDSTIPLQDRILVFSELRDYTDGLGKTIPDNDLATIQHAKYLARTLRGRIEMWRGYEIDCPSFVFRSKGRFVRLQNMVSVGIIRGRFISGMKAAILDTVFHRRPVFCQIYGLWAGFGKMVQWMIACR